MFCENCGHTISDSVAQCPYCGRSTETEHPPVAVGSPAKTSAAAAALQKLPRLTHPKLESGIAGFVRPVLKSLEEGPVMRTIMALFLRILGVLSLLAALFLAIAVATQLMQLKQSQMTIAGLVLAILIVAWGCVALLIFFYRAASLDSLEDSPFPVIPIVSVWFRAIGEIWATNLVLIGVGACLFVWFTGSSPMQFLGPFALLTGSDFSGSGPFLDGMKLLVGGFIGGFAVLIFFYLLAESYLVILDIARNVRTLVRIGERPDSVKQRSVHAPVA